MKKTRQIDMVQGPLLSKLILFSIPVVLSGVLQLLFNAADVIVVGRFTGKEALAAVGSTSSLINLLINLFLGKKYVGMSPVEIIKNMVPASIGSLTMVPISLIGLSVGDNLIWQFILIALCCISYGVTILIIPQSRKIVLPLIEKTLKR